MSGAVPPISPVTGGAIYEATAKAEMAYADAERLADDGRLMLSTPNSRR